MPPSALHSYCYFRLPLPLSKSTPAVKVPAKAVARIIGNRTFGTPATRTVMKALSLDNPWTKASLWGAVGSACMLIVFVLPFESDWIKELLMMASFSFSLMIVMLTVKASSSRRAFLVTFLSSLITWMCMFVLPHLVFVLTQEEEYHLDTWLVMFPQMLTLGIIVCAPLAWLILQIKKHNQLRADQQRQVIG